MVGSATVPQDHEDASHEEAEEHLQRCRGPHKQGIYQAEGVYNPDNHEQGGYDGGCVVDYGSCQWGSFHTLPYADGIEYTIDYTMACGGERLC